MTIETFQVGRRFVLLDGAIALTKVKTGGDQTVGNQKIVPFLNIFQKDTYPNALK